MKLPEKISGKNRIRDAAIMKCFLQENLTYKDIGIKFNLTASRIQQIVFENRGLISWDKNHEKALRINALKRLDQKNPNRLGSKSTIDIQEQLRKEIEGDKPLVDQSTHYSQIIYVREDLKSVNPLSAPRVSAAD
jgi:hypothetical protein